MKKFGALGIIIVLSACSIATTANYEKELTSWVGSSENKLVDAWGTPDQFYESPDEIRHLTYVKSRLVYVSGTPVTYHTRTIGNRTYTTSTGGSSGYAYTRSCKTTFIIQNDAVIDWRHEGNACVS